MAWCSGAGFLAGLGPVGGAPVVVALDRAVAVFGVLGLAFALVAGGLPAYVVAAAGALFERGFLGAGRACG